MGRMFAAAENCADVGVCHSGHYAKGVPKSHGENRGRPSPPDGPGQSCSDDATEAPQESSHHLISLVGIGLPGKRIVGPSRLESKKKG